MFFIFLFEVGQLYVCAVYDHIIFLYIHTLGSKKLSEPSQGPLFAFAFAFATPQITIFQKKKFKKNYKKKRKKNVGF